MSKLVFFARVAFATMCFAFRDYAQGATTAPLYLYINGSGSVTPLQNGQSLVVGQTYDMQAIPDPGFAFDSWSLVHVFTYDSTTLNPDGTTNAPVKSVVVSPGPPSSLEPVLEFTMQPHLVI